MKVLVTGASGYIGHHVAKRLIKRGDQVLALARSKESEARLPDGAVALRGSIEDTHWLDALKEADAVIHTAFSIPAEGIGKAIADEISFFDNLSDRLSGSGKAVLVSNGTIFLGDSGQGRLDEHVPILKDHPAAARGLATQKMIGRAGLRGVEIRHASVVYGLGGGGFIPLLTDAARRNGAAIYIGDGSVTTSCVHVEAAAQGYLDALDLAAPGSTFHLASDEEPTWQQIAQAISVNLGCRAVSVTLADAASSLDPFTAMFMSTNNRLDASHSRRSINWSHAGFPSLLWDTAKGSYAR